YRHWILVVLPQELGFSDTLWTRFHFTGVRQFTLDGTFAFSQLFQQRWCDGQAVTASQFDDFADVTEAGAHNNGLITVLIVVFVDFSHGNRAWVFRRGVLFFVGIGFVPVQNTTHNRRYQVYARFRACARLREGEQQRQVTVDTVFFQLFSSADTLPGRCQFDQDTVIADT